MTLEEAKAYVKETGKNAYTWARSRCEDGTRSATIWELSYDLDPDYPDSDPFWINYSHGQFADGAMESDGNDLEWYLSGIDSPGNADWYEVPDGELIEDRLNEFACS